MSAEEKEQCFHYMVMKLSRVWIDAILIESFVDFVRHAKMPHLVMNSFAEHSDVLLGKYMPDSVPEEVRHAVCSLVMLDPISMAVNQKLL